MKHFDDPAACVDFILERVGRDLKVGLPLAAGKPNHLVNALYRRAKDDDGISLTFYTALTLERPKGKTDLEQRFLGPFVERVFGNYPDLDYELDRVAEQLPPNVRVKEFYFPAGKFVRNASAQRDYISTNYTYVARDLLDRGVNVLLQEVAWREHEGEMALSLSCNADVTTDIVKALAGRDDVVFCAMTNGELPFMFGEAEVPDGYLHALVHNPAYDHTIFGMPRMAVSDQDMMIGLGASMLVKDGGELQIGIGSLGDAIAYALKLRHEDNCAYRDALARTGLLPRCQDVVERRGGLGTFEAGLFAATEMVVDGFMHLVEAGIVKRHVYDDLPLQRLLNAGEITEEVTIDTVLLLQRDRAVHRVLSPEDIAYLQRFGIFRHDLVVEGEMLVLEEGRAVLPDLDDEQTVKTLTEHALGERLTGGAIIHGGFFLGPPAFYQWLRDMPEERRREIQMRSVQRINQLYGHEPLDRLHRRDARFVNTGMMVTLSGAVVSDGLEDGTVISGVGGQYNFVAMAHALPDGHSVIQIRATRESHGEVVSNIVPSYGHTTIPRHQRDLVVTEYGVADLRGKTDEEVIIALLQVADARFQDELMQAAKKSGKLAPDYQLPDDARLNLPERYQRPMAALRADGLFPLFPFGTDLTEEEIVLGKALKRLKKKMDAGAVGAMEAMADATLHGDVDDKLRPYLARMGLEAPEGFKESLYARLLVAELKHVLA
jgi:acyl-CoA hydrolase